MRASVRRALRGAVLGLAVCLLATACGRGEEPEPERVIAARQCDDTLSPEAGRALETVLNTKRFDHDPRGGLDRATGELLADYPEAEGWAPRRSVCRVSAPTSSDEVSIEFRLSGTIDLPGDEHAGDMHPYDMGVEALSGPRRVELYVTCVSPRLQGSDKRPALIMGSLTFLRSKLPDTVPVREATLTVLHSVTLAVVRKLGCEDDAGLTEKPVFKPLPG
ncbi:MULTISPECIES: hypothetical protein [unclassified Streptomyces]|uniref:hypothetical protein n=1 Tax=unclassified Streptomyces TaxID=2593676 RepID=UPI0037029FEF